MNADLVYLVAGASLLLAVVLPALLDRWAVSAPMVLVAVGFAIGLTPLPDGMPIDPAANRALIEHVTEVAVIVALMGVGLALDRPLALRKPVVVADVGVDLADARHRDAADHRGDDRPRDGARASGSPPRSSSPPSSRRPTRSSPPTSRWPGRRPVTTRSTSPTSCASP